MGWLASLLRVKLVYGTNIHFYSLWLLSIPLSILQFHKLVVLNNLIFNFSVIECLGYLHSGNYTNSIMNVSISKYLSIILFLFGHKYQIELNGSFVLKFLRNIHSIKYLGIDMLAHMSVYI